MSDERSPRPQIVPRYERQGYRDDLIDRRRAWVEEQAGVVLEHVGRRTISGEDLRGNIENPIGAVQVPLGVAGPLWVRGREIDEIVYVPLATTEGALVRSYERGMMALTRSGGATARVLRDENQVVPVFSCRDFEAALDLVEWLGEHETDLAKVSGATTRHGRLLGVEASPHGREVRVAFRYSTGDAHGMNMIARATDAACRWVVEQGRAASYLLLSGASGEKRPAGKLLSGGKGKKVVASARLPHRVLRAVLGVDAEALARLWRRTALAQASIGTVGVNGHLANGLTALFIACGQDVANVANAAVGLTSFEVVEDGDLCASVELPSLPVATVGGGTGLGTAADCLALLGCRGAGKARRLAEIVGATCLAGELSFAAALATGSLANAHEELGRNRPMEPDGK